MENYNYLFSSTNPVEIDQIKMVLDREKITYRIIGEQALGVGNVELTGISGATIKVIDSQTIHAKKLLVEMGYDMEIDNTLSKESNKFMVLLTMVALIAGAMISYFLFF